MDDTVVMAFTEIRHLGQLETEAGAIDRIRDLVELLRGDPRATEPVRARLLDSMNRFEVLFSEERRRRYAAPGGTDGAAIVRTYAFAELDAAEAGILGGRRVSPNHGVRK